jgi:alpha-tubulin suppressor-like RCC1 family protein
MHTLALSNNQELYYFGKISTSYPTQTTPIVLNLNLPSPISSIHSGDRFAAFITENGDIYEWGDYIESYNNFGFAQIRSRESPTFVQASNAAMLALGKDHALALTKTGTVLSWGNHQYGGLGRGSLSQPSLVPSIVTGLSNIGQIAAGENSSYALSQDGTRLWSWGWNDVGQLGQGNTTKYNTPREINLTNVLLEGETIIRIAAGDLNGYFITSQGRLFSWGRGAGIDGEWRLGNANFADVKQPTLVNLSTLTNYVIS